jgi:glycosyltransferase involved in cell wall biosynthesis
MLSINLTIHNKEYLLEKVLTGIFKNTTSPFEFIAVLDGCTDKSEEILMSFLQKHDNKYCKQFNIKHTDNIFETKANNLAALLSCGQHICIIQDDMVITEYAWEKQMLKPFMLWDDVFAVTAGCAHNWRHNIDSKGIDENGWSDLLIHCDHANKTNTDKDHFYLRSSVNRGPLMINRMDLVEMGYFDEVFCPQDSDDHDLMYRMKKKLNKICGYVNIDWESRPEWGGTRDEGGKTKQWMLDANIKNAKLLYDRHSDLINQYVKNDTRRKIH